MPSVFPENLRYSAEHEWVREDGDTIRVGITGYAAEALGDVVYVTLPEVGADARPGEAIGEVESTKSVSDVYAPVSGTVTGRNETLEGQPELVNADPYGQGWMFEIRVADPSEVAELMDADAYRDLVESA